MSCYSKFWFSSFFFFFISLCFHFLNNHIKAVERYNFYSIVRGYTCFNAHGLYLMCIFCIKDYYPLVFKNRHIKANYILYWIFLKVWSYFIFNLYKDFLAYLIIHRTRFWTMSCKYSKQLWFRFIIMLLRVASTTTTTQTMKGNKVSDISLIMRIK